MPDPADKRGALVLGRFPGESVILDVPGPCRIEVKVAAVESSKRVAVVLVAPREVVIHRKEIHPDYCETEVPT